MPTRRCLCCLFFLSFLAGPSPVSGQALCVESGMSTGVLGDLFAVGPVTNFSLSLGTTRCSYAFEQPAKQPSFYQGCVNWQAQKQLERIGPGVVSGIEFNDGQRALLGSSNFGVSETLSFESVNASRTQLRGSHGLRINVLGAQLPLPAQSFSVRIDQTPQNSATWEWRTFDLDVGFQVPTAYGDVLIGFKSKFSGTQAASNRTIMYDGLAQNISYNDWSWYRAPSDYWDQLRLSTW